MGIAINLAACSSGPPAFQVEPVAAGLPPPGTESISVATPAAPPPSEQRFARLYADGTAYVREVFTPNGPGPALSLIGRVEVPASLVAAAIASAQAPATVTADRSAPCVAAVDSSPAKWQGCAYPELAARVLASLPRLTMPDVGTACESQACQVRIVRGVSPARHEQYGDVRQDRLLDVSGAFWCAAASADEQAGGSATLRVERGTIAKPGAGRVFEWIAGGIAADRSTSASSQDAVADRVMVRARDGTWRPVADRDAARVRERWARIAPALPESCRSLR